MTGKACSLQTFVIMTTASEWPDDCLITFNNFLETVRALYQIAANLNMRQQYRTEQAAKRQ